MKTRPLRKNDLPRGAFKKPAKVATKDAKPARAAKGPRDAKAPRAATGPRDAKAPRKFGAREERAPARGAPRAAKATRAPRDDARGDMRAPRADARSVRAPSRSAPQKLGARDERVPSRSAPREQRARPPVRARKEAPFGADTSAAPRKPRRGENAPGARNAGAFGTRTVRADADAAPRKPRRGENAPGARNAGAFGTRTVRADADAAPRKPRRGENAPGARNAGAFGTRTVRADADAAPRKPRGASALGTRPARSASARPAREVRAPREAHAPREVRAPREARAPREVRAPREERASGERHEPVFKPRSADGAPVPRKPAKAVATDAPREKPEKRIPKPAPAPISIISEEPHPGMWILTTRLGSEKDVVDELLLAKVVDPAARVLAPALVLAPKLPKREGHPIDLTFARQGFEVLLNVRTHDLDEMVVRIARSVRGQLVRAERYALHVWVADSDEGNALTALAEDVEARLEARISHLLPEISRVDDAALRRLGTVPFVQVCLLEPSHAAAGVMHSNRAISLARGGRTRVRITGDFPSRAARKVEEALAWLGDGPGPAELCVDLGAAPGGWTYMLLKRRARVIAVDPAKLKPDILEMKGVRHVQESAFTFTPDEPVDWLFCDMAWRPLEAAALLAKWGRRRWARMLVANVKLPMTRKAELVARVRDILTLEGHWKNVHVKQLYHDREEVTITAHLG